MANKVERSAARWGHHWDPTRQGLLDRLAECLVGTSVHENIQRGDGLGQRSAAAESEERRFWQLSLHRGALRTVTHHHQSAAAKAAQMGKEMDLLLLGQATDVA